MNYAPVAITLKGNGYLGSISGQVYQYFENFILLNASNKVRIMKYLVLNEETTYSAW